MYEISHANCVYSNVIASFSSLEYFTEIYQDCVPWNRIDTNDKKVGGVHDVRKLQREITWQKKRYNIKRTPVTVFNLLDKL